MDLYLAFKLLLLIFLQVNSSVIKTSNVDRIIGGSLADPGQFPYQIFLKTEIALCGGSIISADWILTAAHCVEGVTNATIIAGTITLNPLDSSAQIRTSVQIFIHPNYNPMNLNNDIAALKVSKPFEFSDFVAPIQIATKYEDENNTEGELAVSSGWGLARENGTVENKLLFAEMFVVNQKNCQETYASGWVFDGVICAENSKENKTICKGDSGGPLVSKSSGHLIGITSFGNSCEPLIPGGFARITYYLNWIKKTTGIY